MNLAFAAGRMAALGLLLCFVGFTGCSKREQEDVQPAEKLFPQHIILIGIDTLRAGNLSCYGYPIITTPAIDAFARKATLYERSISQSSWTLPSFASIFTSLYHHEHKSGLPCRQGRDEERQFDITILDDSFTTLAERLKARGYKTAAFTEGALMSPVFGVSQGFDLFKICSVLEDPVAMIKGKLLYQKDVKNIIDNSLAWIGENREKSFFLFLHTYETHEPLKDPLKVFEKTKAEYIKNGFLEQMKTCYLETHQKEVHKEKVYQALCKERMLYDCEIKYTDLHVGRFFKELKKMGLFDKSLIILTSDHGEEFGEHGAVHHGNNLYQESIAVPLIVKKPGQKEGLRENSFVAEGVDILPTILEACRTDTSRMQLSGQSLFSKLPGTVARSHLFTNKKSFASGVQNFQKAIFSYKDPAKSALFDLARDPLEKQNVLPAQQSREALMPFIQPDRIPQTIDSLCFDEFSREDRDVRMQLKALGYVE